MNTTLFLVGIIATIVFLFVGLLMLSFGSPRKQAIAAISITCVAIAVEVYYRLNVA